MIYHIFIPDARFWVISRQVPNSFPLVENFETFHGTRFKETVIMASNAFSKKYVFKESVNVNLKTKYSN